ncbi:uncharacterized protein PG998_015182 [Apiospora kogelbergensis]|uniref:uncharacterized protein n=1 Tax=Apiospora kogelbergensis TaxID=1337665 RepID=UPI0031320379
MQIIKLVIAAIASTSAVCALPASGTTKAKIEDKRATQEDYDGECNGTSCYLFFQNIACTQGTSTAQSGGGDGKTCRVHDFGNGNAYAICPGRAG